MPQRKGLFSPQRDAQPGVRWGVHGLLLLMLFLTLLSPLAASPAAFAQTRVFAIVPKSLDNPFFADVEAGAAVAARELGVELQFVGPATHDIAGQIAVLESLIESGVDGIAVSPTDAASVSPVIRRAIQAGIPVITFDSEALPDSGRIAFVGTDNYAGGVAAGEAFIRALPRGKYAILTGGLGAANLNARIDGFRDVLAKFPGAYEEIPGSPFPSDDDIQRAVQIVEDLITANPDLDGIYMSGGWAQFAPEAYTQALGSRAGDVKTESRDGSLVIVSFDILEPQLHLIKNGLSTANVSQRPYDMGYQSMYILNRLANGETLEREFYDTGVAVVTEANVDEYLP